MKKIGTVLVVVIFAGLALSPQTKEVAKAMMVKVEKQEIIVKCNELKKQSIEFKTDGFSERNLFWISQSDKEMCDGVNINISAPIGDPYEKNI